jgi:hypothetical protein
MTMKETTSRALRPGVSVTTVLGSPAVIEERPSKGTVLIRYAKSSRVVKALRGKLARLQVEHVRIS